jgi:hypothetical protein
MAFTIHDASVRAITRALTNLVHVLEKAAAHCEAKKIEPSVLVNARLFPDMFPLSKQVQIATDVAKIGTSRLAGVEAPKWEDNETTFADLIARVKKTLAYLETVKTDQLNPAADRAVTFPAQGESATLPGPTYLMTRVLPNVFFHCTTTYNILRHNGVEIGKGDFLGAIKDW